MSSAHCTIFTPGIGTQSFTPISSGENSAFVYFAAVIANHYNLTFFVPPGNHYCWIGRGSMVWGLCQTLLCITSSGTGASNGLRPFDLKSIALSTGLHVPQKGSMVSLIMANGESFRHVSMYGLTYTHQLQAALGPVLSWVTKMDCMLYTPSHVKLFPCQNLWEIEDLCGYDWVLQIAIHNQ